MGGEGGTFHLQSSLFKLPQQSYRQTEKWESTKRCGFFHLLHALHRAKHQEQKQLTFHHFESGCAMTSRIWSFSKHSGGRMFAGGGGVPRYVSTALPLNGSAKNRNTRQHPSQIWSGGEWSQRHRARALTLKSQVKHNPAWSRYGWATIMC